MNRRFGETPVVTNIRESALLGFKSACNTAIAGAYDDEEVPKNEADDVVICVTNWRLPLVLIFTEVN